jgi:hypothetical protein
MNLPTLPHEAMPGATYQGWISQAHKSSHHQYLEKNSEQMLHSSESSPHELLTPGPHSFLVRVVGVELFKSYHSFMEV